MLSDGLDASVERELSVLKTLGDGGLGLNRLFVPPWFKFHPTALRVVLAVYHILAYHVGEGLPFSF